jgi:hypothetical protein
MVFMPNKSTPDYLFEKANQCFRRSRTDSNARVELEALGNEFMVKAVELDIKLQKIANGNYTGRWSFALMCAPSVAIVERTA